MKCYLCRREGDVKWQERSVCERCFCKLIEKRVRRWTRQHAYFSKGDRILVIGDLNRHFVKEILGGLPAKLFFAEKESRAFARKNRINKIVISWSMDDEVCAFLGKIFFGKKHKEDKKHIKMLMCLTDDEQREFARIKKIRFKPNKKDKKILEFLESLMKKYPDTMFKILRSAEALEALI